MTTYQEPPLQSRRAALQGERADAPHDTNADPGVVSAAYAPPAESAVPLRPEPLNYATTSRPPLPQYDGQNQGPRRAAENHGYADLPPTEALPRQYAASHRPTDYSPEGRRAAAPSWADSSDASVDSAMQNRDQAPIAPAPLASEQVPPAAVEHTMTRRELRALREADGTTSVFTEQMPLVVPDGVGVSPGDPAVARSDAQSAAPVIPVFDAPVFDAHAPEPVALVSPPPLVAPAPQPSTRLDSALAEFDALAAGREAAVPAPDAPVPLPGRRAAQPMSAPADEVLTDQLAVGETYAAPEPPHRGPAQAPATTPTSQGSSNALSAFDALFSAPSSAPVSNPEVSSPPAAPQLWTPPIVAPAPLPEAVVDPLLSAPAPQGAPALAPPPVISPPSAAPSSGTTSFGHWSTQSDIDDAEQVSDATISRSVGAGSAAITTSALMLSSVPEHTIGGPMSGNGEILLTGSISLPHSFSATGAHPSQLDGSDLDHMLDPGDHQVANTDSTPVRAIRAVSTHTATGTIIAPMKPKGTRGFTILIVAASVMAFVVVGLLVAGLVSGTL